jgi:hypothetical protein
MLPSNVVLRTTLFPINFSNFKQAPLAPFSPTIPMVRDLLKHNLAWDDASISDFKSVAMERLAYQTLNIVVTQLAVINMSVHVERVIVLVLLIVYSIQFDGMIILYNVRPLNK